MASKLVCLWLITMVVIGAAIGSDGAVTCGQVYSSLSQCINYVTGKAVAVPPPCCNGVKSLNAAAKTTPDRRSVCSCLKSLTGSIKGINYGLVSGLPGKCGVSIPYKISPSTDCNKIN